MLVVALLVLLFAASRLTGTVLLICATVLFCAVAVMHWTASLHLADPLAPLYAFLGAAFVARFASALAAEWVKSKTG